MSENLREHPAVVAWRALSPSARLPDHIVVLKRKAKGAVYRLPGVGPGGQAVIAKRCSREKAAIERAVYEQVLPTLPVETLAFHGHVEEGDGASTWLFLEDVGAECYAPDDPEHRRLAARWLALLHTSAGAAEVKATFPERGAHHHRRYLGATLEMLPRYRAFPTLGSDGVGVLERIGSLCERIGASWSRVEALCDAAPGALVHSDCLAKNVHFRSTAAGRRVAPFDWGGAGWGVAATDLGQLALPRRGPPGDAPDCAAYLEEARRRWTDLDLECVGQLANLGQLFWALKVTSRGLPELDCDWARPEDAVRNLAIYADALARSLQVLHGDAGAVASAAPVRARSAVAASDPRPAVSGDARLHDALDAWRSLAAGASAPLGIEVLKPEVSGTAVYRLDLGADGCVVAKRSPRATVDVERAVYEQILPRIPVTAPRYRGTVEEAGSSFAWLFVEDAGGTRFRPERDAHRAAAARWLALLHRGCAGLDRIPALPGRRAAHYRALLAGGVAALRERRGRAVDAGARELLADLLGKLERVEARWGELERACDGAPEALVHGDLVDHNAHVREQASGLAFLPFDWEKAGWGVAAEDLAGVDLAAYEAACADRPSSLDPAALRRLASAGRIFRCLVYLDWVTSRPGAGEAEPELVRIERCGSWLDPLLARGAWLA